MVSIIETESNNNNNQPNQQHNQQQFNNNNNNNNTAAANNVINMASQDTTITTTAAAPQTQQQQSRQETGSAVSQRSIEIEITPKSNIDNELAKRTLKLDLVNAKNVDNYTIKSPKSPLSITGDVRGGRLSHQTSISSQVEAVEDRKTLRDALYQGIFHRHRKTIFAMGSFLRMLRSRNSQYNTIRSTDGEDIDDAR